MCNRSLEECQDEKTDIFYDELHKQVNKYNKTGHLLILGDPSARIDNNPIKNVV